jgi:hypothetical protein
VSTVVEPSPDPVVVRQATSAVVVVERAGSVVIAPQTGRRSVVIVQGVPGRSGDAAGGALLVANRLSEFDDETKKAAARSNLGLQVIDGGTFF